MAGFTRSAAGGALSLALVLGLSAGIAGAAESQTITLTLAPSASGTIRSMPELGHFGPAPVGDTVQSTYFKTTDTNREFRRGFFELAIPPCSEIERATLTLNGGTGATTNAILDTHELAWYAPADLAITTADWNKGTLIATFETDQSVAFELMTFDVTTQVSAAQGGTIGFRVKLADDPTRTSFSVAGEEFLSITLEIVCTPTIDDLITGVQGLVDSASLNSGQGNALKASLEAAISSIEQGNTKAAIQQLEAFIAKLDTWVSSGVLTADEAAPLLEAARALLKALEDP